MPSSDGGQVDPLVARLSRVETGSVELELEPCADGSARTGLRGRVFPSREEGGG